MKRVHSRTRLKIWEDQCGTVQDDGILSEQTIKMNQDGYLFVDYKKTFAKI